jgi:uroporphyrinogen III methyltransferase / synthase
MPSDPLVFLVGAGPGRSGLLTLRAVECLRQADLVLYDRLVSPLMLHHAPAHAERVCVTELAPCHVDRAAPIHQLLIDAALAGKRVVRLKGGDPFLFGRGGEEAEALVAAGIPFEVVPGVTAALGAAAYAGIPLTHRAHASAVAFVTGHENAAKGEPGVDWAALARFPGTLVIYMGFSRLGALARTLIAHGKRADTPAAVVQSVATGNQRTITAALGDIAAAVEAAGLTAPAIVLIGAVVSLRTRLAWFEGEGEGEGEGRPLLGKRVLVTRPQAQADHLIGQLEALGAVPVEMPVVAIGPPADWGPVDAALAQLSRYQWLVFTSVNGVEALVKRLRERGKDLRALGALQLAAIGPSTADALRAYHLQPDVVPPEYRSESLAAALRPHVAGKRVLLARADRGRDVLRDELQRVAEVDQVAVYAQVEAVQADAAVLHALRRQEIDYVLLTSSNIARALGRLLDEPCRAALRANRTQIVSISPVTSAAIGELGWPVAAEAREYTMAGLVQALVELAAGISGRP